MQASQLLTEMQTLLHGLPEGKTRQEWCAVHAEAWACVTAETLLPRLRPTDERPPLLLLRLEPPAALHASQVRTKSSSCAFALRTALPGGLLSRSNIAMRAESIAVCTQPQAFQRSRWCATACRQRTGDAALCRQHCRTQ